MFNHVQIRPVEKLLVLLICGIVFNSCQNSSHDSRESNFSKQTWVDSIDLYLNAMGENKHFNGQVLIGNSKDKLFFKSYGFSDRENKVGISDSSKFLIGSITKTFTAACILILQEQGKLSIKDSLYKYFPDFKRSKDISLENLMMHTSGIRDYHELNTWKSESMQDLPVDYTISQLSKSSLRFEPGSDFRYSNTGYILLGLIIEKVSGLSFEAFLQKEILSKLSLKETGVIENDKDISNLAKPYKSTPRGVKPADWINYKQPFTSGNMYSTCTDLKTFTYAIVENKLLPTKYNELIFNTKEPYGFGWGTRQFEDYVAFGHHGAMNGYSGSITYLPQDDVFVCFLTNDDNTPRNKVFNDLIKMLKHDSIVIPRKINYVEHRVENLKKHEGSYLIKQGDTIRIRRRGNQLFLKETGQEEMELYAVDSNSYKFNILEFEVRFDQIRNNQAHRLYLTNSQATEAIRIKD
ncbi:MAG: serine hydrolase domain-containing protein [Bacteroidia bacterium]